MLKVVVFTEPGPVSEKEFEIIDDLFKAGLYRLHVRKQKFSSRQMKRYLKNISSKYRRKVIIHSHHGLASRYRLGGVHLTEKARLNIFAKLRVSLLKLSRPDLVVTTSFHKLSDMEKNTQSFHYVFLSPVFESISKKEHSPNYSLATISRSLEKKDKLKVFALGGVDASKIIFCKQTGFYGIGLLGTIWNSEDPIEDFKTIMEKCEDDFLKY